MGHLSLPSAPLAPQECFTTAPAQPTPPKSAKASLGSGLAFPGQLLPHLGEGVGGWLVCRPLHSINSENIHGALTLGHICQSYKNTFSSPEGCLLVRGFTKSGWTLPQPTGPLPGSSENGIWGGVDTGKPQILAQIALSMASPLALWGQTLPLLGSIFPHTSIL